LGSHPWDAEDERALAQLVAGTIVPGANYHPDTYVPPAPAKGTASPDQDEDGIPDSMDARPSVFSAWDDTDNDGWTDLEAYQNSFSTPGTSFSFIDRGGMSL
jgi:hypothetical protein